MSYEIYAVCSIVQYSIVSGPVLNQPANSKDMSWSGPKSLPGQIISRLPHTTWDPKWYFCLGKKLAW